MRKQQLFFIIAVLTLGAVLTVQADVPQLINYQGILKSSGGDPVTSLTNVIFAIWDNSVGGDSLWSELRTVEPDGDGLFNVALGSISPIPDSCFWGTNLYLSVKVDTDPEMTPRQRLMATGYAFSDAWGRNNTARGTDATIGGGENNTASGYVSTVGGGWDNTVSNYGATVGGGVDNTASGITATVGGGTNNAASGFSSTVGGGVYNNARGRGSVVAGGGISGDWSGSDSNSALGYCSAILGGAGNIAEGDSSSIGGGVRNLASGRSSTIGGGSNNIVTGGAATVPGGNLNEANGAYSFAAGQRAKVLAGHHGTFVWADQTNADFTSTATDQFLIRASGGVGIGTNNPGTSTTLEVSDEVDPSYVEMVRFESTSDPDNSDDILAIKVPSTATDLFQFIECERGTDIKFRVWGHGNVTADGSFIGGGADFAELIHVTTGYNSVEAGDVMVIDPESPESMVQSTSSRSTLVAGIYSTKPGFLGSEHDWDKVALQMAGAAGVNMEGADAEVPAYPIETMAASMDEVPLAVVGIVPCKVSAENGAIQPGDLLVTSSTPGHAMRDVKPDAGTILGKALSSLSDGTGVIKVLVTLQ